MWKHLSVFLLSSVLLFCAASESIKPVSYQFAAPTLKDAAHSDPDRTKLTDGVLTLPSRVIWQYKDNQKAPVKIEFLFGVPVKLENMKIHYYRGKKSYGIKQISLFAVRSDGTQVPMGGAALNQPPTRPDNAPENDHVTIKTDSEEVLEKLVVIIQGTGSYLGLFEVEFEGNSAEKNASGGDGDISGNPFQNLADTPAAGLRLSEKNNVFILENRLAVYVIDPDNNGCVNYAYDRAGKFNFLKYGSKNGYGGMFNDRFWPSSARDVFFGVAYKPEVVADSPEKKSLRLSASGKSGIFSNVTIEKTYTLESSSPVLKVDYKIINDQANVIPLQYGLWIMGGITDEKPFGLIYPGAYRLERNPSKPQNLFCPGAVRGWCAALNNSGNGLALLCRYELFKCFYFWSNNNRSSTMECRLGIYSIKANESLQTSFALVPFYGIGTPDNITADMAGTLGLKDQYAGSPEKLELKLLPFRAGKYQVRIEAGRIHQGKIKFGLVKTADFSGDDTPVAIPYELKAAPGTWAVRAVVTDHGKMIFEMNASCIVGQSSGSWLLPSECAKRPESEAGEQKLNLDFHSLSVETPHVKWAKPFAGKAPKVLAVCYQKGGIRDMVEMAQRFDMDLTTNYIGGVWKLSGLCQTLNENDAYNELLKKLKQRFDSIVVASDMWKRMPQNVREAILAQVKDGSGLVMIAPEGHPAELSAFFGSLPADRHFIGKWNASASHPIVNGVPLETLPPTRGLPYKTNGEILAKIGEYPLLSVFSCGKGRIVAAAWATDGRDRMNAYHKANAIPVFLPLMLFNMPKNLEYHYWEYQMSLFAKMIYWSAGCRGNVNGSELSAVPGKFSAVLNAETPQNVTAELTIRDKFYRTVECITQKLELKKGDYPLELKFNVPGLAGLNFADLVVKGEKGTEWWGSASFENPATVIAGIKLEDKIWKKNESLAGSVELSSPAEIRLTFYDSFGNVFARSSGKDFSIPLQDCRTLTCTVDAEALKDGKVIDRATRDVTLYGKPDARRLQVVFGWPILSQKGVQSFLLPSYYEQLKELGATAILAFHTDTPVEILTARKCGLPLLASNTPASSGGKFPFDGKAQIKSKFDLIRKPCLSAPGFKDDLEKKSDCVTDLEEYGVLFRAGPDESNSVGVWEGCFSEDCRKEFRNWLKKQYGSLEELNRSWEMNYGSWDEVVAMTSAEAKKHTSFAPWQDHRTFNEWNLADAIGRIVKGLKKSDPDNSYSLSGTQNPTAFNAWEWYQLSQALGALQSYGGEQTVMQRCFAPRKLIWQTWTGYDQSLAVLEQKILTNLIQGATGFSVYSGDFYVNPDYTLPPRAIELKKALGRYQNGPAEAIMNSTLVTYPIAFLYSPASVKTDWILGADDLRVEEINGYRTLLFDLGLNYDYIASAQVEKDGIDASKYRILFLSAVSAMSGKEMNDVRKFVEDGGTVVADFLPGGYDAHGKKNPGVMLADVFGIKNTKPTMVQNRAELEGLKETVSGLTLDGLKISVKAFESGVEPLTAKSIAKITCKGEEYPAVLVNRYGKGTAVYLAASLPGTVADWAEMRYMKNNNQNLKVMYSFLEGLLKPHGIKPFATAPTLTACELVVRRNGPAYLLGIIRQNAQAVNLDPKENTHTVYLPEKFHIYDLLNNRYVGYGSQFNFIFGPATQSLFALLPYKPGKPEVEWKKNGAGFIAGITLAGDAKQWTDHIFRVCLSDPDGKENPAYSELLFGNGNHAEFRFKLPLDAGKGTWLLRVTDVLTGESVTVPVK